MFRNPFVNDDVDDALVLAEAFQAIKGGWAEHATRQAEGRGPFLSWCYVVAIRMLMFSDVDGFIVALAFIRAVASQTQISNFVFFTMCSHL